MTDRKSDDDNEAMWTAADCPRCDGERVIHVEDRPYPNDISPTSHQEPCPECTP